MSERAKAMGNKGPKKVIEHNGRAYTVAPVVTEGTMLQVEERLYARAKRALRDQQDMLPEPEYLKRADDLRARYERGEYAFESRHTLEFLQTEKGAMLLLSVMLGASEAEAFELLSHKSEEVKAALEDAMALSFPGDAGPKADGPRTARGRSR